MKDWLIVSFLGGIFGTLGDEVIHWGAVYLKFVNSTTGHYISQLIFPNQEVTLPKLIMGECTHFLAGGTMGVAIYYIFKVSGFKYSIIKGVGFGSITWILHVAIIPNLVLPCPFIYRTFNESIVDLISHLVWGAIGAGYISISLDQLHLKRSS